MELKMKMKMKLEGCDMALSEAYKKNACARGWAGFGVGAGAGAGRANQMEIKIRPRGGRLRMADIRAV